VVEVAEELVEAVHGGQEPVLVAQVILAELVPGKKRRTASGARLLAVGVGEPHTLVGDPVDIRRPVAHQAVAVPTQVRDAEVVTPDDEDVRLVRHAFTSLSRGPIGSP
jgi:hypothetical protein